MDSRCVIVVPVYKRRVEGSELHSLMRCVEVYGSKFEIRLAVPKSLDISFYRRECPSVGFTAFPDEYFQSYAAYNRTCKSTEFYDAFSGFEYMLIYQLDCWAFDDGLSTFIDAGFDYVAPPVKDAANWPSSVCVGCGGCSLRRINAFRRLSFGWCDVPDNMPEDLYFSRLAAAGKMRACDPNTATRFCITSDDASVAQFWLGQLGRLPSFCHKFATKDLPSVWSGPIAECQRHGLHFITFANTQSGFSRERVMFEAERMKCFDSVTFYDETDFDWEYWGKYKDRFSGRGYGYWTWKPYFIKQKLSEVRDGDVVVYADAGCMLLEKNRRRLLEWAARARYSPSGVLSMCYGPYYEKNWTKGDVFKYVDENYGHGRVNIYGEDAVQCGAGAALIVKKKKACELIDAWNKAAEERYDLFTDSPSKVPSHPAFRENRHDQSVFSTLSKVFGIETVETKNGILDKANSPVICARCVNDKDTWKKPVRVLYDNQIFDMQKFGGISKVFSEILLRTDRNQILDNFTGSGHARGEYARCMSRIGVASTLNENLLQYGLVPKAQDNPAQANRLVTAGLLAAGDFDVFVPTFYGYDFLDRLGGKPFVLFVPDMITELYPQFFPAGDLQNVGRRKLAPLAAAIMVPTQNTKNDVVRLLGVDESKVHVISHGISAGYGKRVLQGRPRFPYILYVGHRRAYKGFGKFMAGVKPVLDKRKDLMVLCTGPAFQDDEVQRMRSMGVAERVVYFHASDDVQMATLYRNAEMFVYPSEYEGFGIPILEAYASDCPVLLNDNQCFREVAGSAAVFYDNGDPAAVAAAVERVLSMRPADRQALLAAQRQRLSLYSWEKTADKVAGVYRGVVHGA